ncbi:MAG: hypothetical protein QGH66_09250, partial [Dehalococcoidia bacterium]|nr:hypothetical protein [Dehalococcoidia bacterium]
GDGRSCDYVITKLPQAECEVLLRRPDATAFRGGDRIYRTWLHLSVGSTAGLDDIISLVRQSYEAVCSKR